MAEMIANMLFLFVLIGAVAGLGHVARNTAARQDGSAPAGAAEYDLGRDIAAGLKFLGAAGRAHADRLGNYAH
jgi:Na+-transporting methylmalonyl-CoA/oxaloacetate decarboxylase gamma subunit